jgi:hypothetical protein
MSSSCIGYAEYSGIKSYLIVPFDICYTHQRAKGTNIPIRTQRSYTTLTSILSSAGDFTSCIQNTIVLDKMYVLPNLRNIDLYDFMKLINGSLVNLKGKTLLPKIGTTFAGEFLPRDTYYRIHYHQIYYILHTYPGVFTCVAMNYYYEIISIIYTGLCNIVDPFMGEPSNTF